MKVAEITSYGGPEVVTLRHTSAPVAKGDELVVGVRASTVSRVDSIFRRGQDVWARLFTGLWRPRRSVLGTELSGVVLRVGPEVQGFRPGDEVIAAAPGGTGAHAEELVLREGDAIVKKPPGLSFEEAATLCNSALTALPFLRDLGKVKQGDRVLVVGAAGSIGSVAVQLAAMMGAEVVGMCSPRNASLVRELGATKVLDYRLPMPLRGAGVFDLVFDAVGQGSYEKYVGHMRPTGRYMTTVLSVRALWDGLRTRFGHRARAHFAATGLRSSAEQRKDLQWLLPHYESGALRVAIDRRYPFEEIREAHAYLDSGRKMGNVVLTFA